MPPVRFLLVLALSFFASRASLGVESSTFDGAVVQDDRVCASTDVPVDFAPLANDSGDWVRGSFFQPAYGTISAVGNNSLTYTPEPGFAGFDRFFYTIGEEGNPDLLAEVRIAVPLAPSVIVFSDQTTEAGVDYLQHTLPAPADDIVMPHYMSGSAAAGDFDRDGWPDLYVTRFDAPDILFRNAQDGTFEDATADSGIVRGAGSNGSAWGDIDNDGDLDLYVTTIDDTRFYLYINDGAGHFVEDAVARGAAIEGPDSHFGQSVTFGDYDNDGYLDIHTSEWRMDGLNPTQALSNSRLLHNLGALAPGTFEDVTEAAGVALDLVDGGLRDGTFSFASRFTDLDNDGHVDLLIAGDFYESRLFWNNGDGTFSDGTVAAGVGTERNGMGSAVADINRDGRLDWVVTSIYAYGDPEINGNRLFVNNGDRTFSDATDAAGMRDGAWGWGATFIDYDNDGDNDLVHTNGIDFPGAAASPAYVNDETRFWVNDGVNGIHEIGACLGVQDDGSGKGILKFDYDRDGDLDIFIVNNGDHPVLYRNDGGNASDWLQVDLDGPAKGVGARILATPVWGELSQVWEVHAGSNYLGQDEITAHFGLGANASSVFKLRIDWPDGEVQTLFDVTPNQSLTVTKGVVYETPLIDTRFDRGPEGFAYQDDLFRGTSQPAYAFGVWANQQGDTGGALLVGVGGVNGSNIDDMSGGFEAAFTLEAETPVRILVRYRLAQAPNYESNEFSEALMSIDGVLVGPNGQEILARLTGDGNGGDTKSTGWQVADLVVGPLAAGQHSIRLGAYNNRKTTTSEVSGVWFDEVLVIEASE